MLRALFLLAVTLVAAGPALAAGDIDTCRDAAADPVVRLAACETVIADDKITGKTKASAFWVRGDSLMKKRDYDNAIAAFSAAHDIDGDNVGYLNSRGIAYMSKGDDEHALADYDLCLQMRPNFGNAYNNRGIIFLRKLDFQARLRWNSTPPSNPARAGQAAPSTFTTARVRNRCSSNMTPRSPIFPKRRSSMRMARRSRRAAALPTRR